MRHYVVKMYSPGEVYYFFGKGDQDQYHITIVTYCGATDGDNNRILPDWERHIDLEMTIPLKFSTIIRSMICGATRYAIEEYDPEAVYTRTFI
jgi:hypothetical protein